MFRPFIVLLPLTLHALVAAAQPFDARNSVAPVLQLGSRTIGGPGRIVLDEDEVDSFFADGGDSDVCATLFNSGESGDLRLRLGTSGGDSSTPVRPGSTKTVCAAVTSFSASCVAHDGPCTGEWRVDLR
jgi:hypothetical protein